MLRQILELYDTDIFENSRTSSHENGYKDVDKWTKVSGHSR